MGDPMLTYTLFGPPRTKKNSQRTQRNAAGRPFVAPSRAFADYERKLPCSNKNAAQARFCRRESKGANMQYKLTIPGRLPGLNELIEAERANRYKGAQLKKDAERRICAEIRRQLHGVHIRRPVVMRYLWVEPDRRRDRDNITAGRKFVQDALVRCKVLQNDGWKEIIGFSDDWAVDKARPRVEIEITEMEDKT